MGSAASLLGFRNQQQCVTISGIKHKGFVGLNNHRNKKVAKMNHFFFPTTCTGIQMSHPYFMSHSKIIFSHTPHSNLGCTLTFPLLDSMCGHKGGRQALQVSGLVDSLSSSWLLCCWSTPGPSTLRVSNLQISQGLKMEKVHLFHRLLRKSRGGDEE